MRSHPVVLSVLELAASLSVLVYLLVATPVLGLLAVVLSFVPPRGNAVCSLGRIWSRGVLLFGGVRLRARFAVPLEPKTSYVYLANHQSYLDIPALLSTIPNQVRFAAKRSLFLIPIFGWALAAGGFIPIDRRDRSKARQAFAKAAQRLAKGVSVFFFPEGTRSFDGDLGEFERGGFLLALRSGLTIVPVGVRGAYEAFPRHRLSIRPGRIDVVYGKPIDPADYGIRRMGDLIADVRAEIATLAGIGAGPSEAPLPEADRKIAPTDG